MNIVLYNDQLTRKTNMDIRKYNFYFDSLVVVNETLINEKN